MRPTRRAWWVFAAGTAAASAALAWVTALAVRLEIAQHDAYAEAQHQASIRLALWRMDSWMAPLLAREAARPVDEYRAFSPQQNVYTRVLRKIDPGEVLAASPLLGFRSELFELHFECDERGVLTSPQVPTGNWRDLAEGEAPALIETEAQRRALEELRLVVLPKLLEEHCRQAEARLPPPGCRIGAPLLGAAGAGAGEQPAAEGAAAGALEPLVQPLAQKAVDPTVSLDLANRSQVYNATQQWVVPGREPLGVDAPAEVSPLTPLWLTSAGAPPKLVFVRRVRARGSSIYQGVLASWPRLRAALLAQVADLFPSGAVELEPQHQPAAVEDGAQLATVPARLAASPAPATRTAWSPTRTALAGAWAAMVLAVAALGFTLRSTLALGERRARFASAVTHELRTPLTTFKMYSEMLAEGMVRDPGRRAEYLATLRGEADRLARLVENVLFYSRLEEGRYRGRRERLTLAELMRRTVPALHSRAADAGMQLQTSVQGGELELETDADAVAQILFNLVDNACKYAAGSVPATIELRAAASGRGARIEVRDRGQGIAPEHARAVFKPFERGARAASGNEPPGVGLGLALARGLALDLGGRLELDRRVRDGAAFVLHLG